jgi:hypothetical protein
VYGSRPADLDELKTIIHEEIAPISEGTFWEVMQGFFNSCAPVNSTGWWTSKGCTLQEVKYCKKMSRLKKQNMHSELNTSLVKCYSISKNTSLFLLQSVLQSLPQKCICCVH